jgi:TetR/AcrR family transcriptional regulator
MTTQIKPNKKEVTREKNQLLILNAAEQLFSLNGYDGASMSMVAKEANVPKANILYYFKSKDGLYEAVIDRIIANWNLGLDNVTAEDDPAAVLYNYIKSKVILAVNQPLQSRLFANEILRGAPYLQNYFRTNTRPWVKQKIDVFQSWMDAKKIDQVDPHHLLFTIWSTTQYYADFQAEVLLVMNKLEYDETDVAQITQSIAHIILKGIGLKIPVQNES